MEKIGDHHLVFMRSLGPFRDNRMLTEAEFLGGVQCENRSRNGMENQMKTKKMTKKRARTRDTAGAARPVWHEMDQSDLEQAFA